MPSMRDIRRRIRSVASIEQITRAMKMVATAKLRRIQGRMLAMRPYTAQVAALMGRFWPQLIGAEHPLLKRRPVRQVGVVLFSGEQGLCGSHNHNLARAFDEFARQHAAHTLQVAAMGKKGVDHCRRRGIDPFAQYVDVYDTMSYTTAVAVSGKLAQAHADGQFDELYFVYARYINTMTQTIAVQRILPFDLDVVPKAALGDVPPVYLAEPSPEELAGQLVTEYMHSQTYQAMLESAGSEHAARMTAMDTASDNAEDVMDVLIADLNRARQKSITLEILDIVGGAEALRTS